MTQTKLVFTKSLNPSKEQIRYNLACKEWQEWVKDHYYIRLDEFVQLKTGKTLHEYLSAPFDRLKYARLMGCYRNGVRAKINVFSI
jgi:hypothetical protein